MSLEPLIPVAGCWVRRREEDNILGQVCQASHESGIWKVEVNWAGKGLEWVPLSALRSGFIAGFDVQDVPVTTTRKPLGSGRVLASRIIAGREQVLVQLHDDGRLLWLPYENLRRIKDASLRYERAESGKEDHAERFRLRVLSHALESWNQITGALDRLDVDPLPHQIQLVHKILTSGNSNWLIADDVGLGKTIEVGLLLAALKRRNQARRVLIVTPASLVRQWQDELRYKFDQEYSIYGTDFMINAPQQWKLFDHVIASIDLIKRDDHVERFNQSDGWDIVVFDEAHKLTRYESGERAQRYRLAETLRKRSDAFLFLSATPHQGYADRFLALLELVRPDLRPQLQTMELNPQIVSELILRNKKLHVTDAEGNFIFKGQLTHRVAIEASAETQSFQGLLANYLRRGYKASQGSGSQGRAIGFVMTVYRKLASSSVAAIEHALILRRERLLAAGADEDASYSDDDYDALSEGGDDQDDLVKNITRSKAHEFFEYERAMLDQLIASATELRHNDEKLAIFLERVCTPVTAQNEKLLIFTEYRATQLYLKQALETHFRDTRIVLINGSMSLDEKLDSIAAFSGDAQFLISTEAGGEGINLHRACHLMVNYDLPWNPSRLVQRVGRLYRYGQNKPVVVFNLHAKDSFDNAAIDLMLGRVSQIVRDMAPVGDEFNNRLFADIVGELLENLDLASVLQQATDLDLGRTARVIEEAIEKARRAKELQDELFSKVSGFDPTALEGMVGFTMHHVESFVRGILPRVSIDIVGNSHRDRVIELRLPEDMKGRFSDFGQRTVVRVTADREIAQQIRDVHLLDFESDFFRWLIASAQQQQFDGMYASVSSGPESGVLAAFLVRWQNDQGETTTEEFVSIFRNSEGQQRVNPGFLSGWLTKPFGSAPRPNAAIAERKMVLSNLSKSAELHLADKATKFSHPNSCVLLAAADIYS